MLKFRRAKVNTKKTKLYIYVDPEQLDDMLGTVQVTSSDYNRIQALIAGDVDYFMGFHLIKPQILGSQSVQLSSLVGVLHRGSVYL
jgi:hypothetical protein